MSNIDFSKMVTAEDKATERLKRARVAAEDEVLAALSAAADQLTGVVPEAEKLSWPDKEAAAKAMLAGSATDDQLAMLNAEVQSTGETIEELATTVTAKAAAYRQAAAQMAGLRRATIKAVSAATTPEAVAAAIGGFRQALSAFSA